MREAALNVAIPAVTEQPIRSSEDMVRLRQMVRDRAMSAGLSLVDQTKIVTAASELGRNTLIYGGGGKVIATSLEHGGRRGIRLEFCDEGPGIPDIPKALSDGFTTGSGLGLGLGGAKRLSDEFHIDSAPGKGTRVVIVKWRPR